MARINRVGKARKDQGRCAPCGEPILAGQAYKWVKPRAYRGGRGIKRSRHIGCPTWRRSELTSSEHLGNLYGADETVEDFIAEATAPDFEGLAAAMDDALSMIDEARSGYEEAADNIEDGFGHSTYISDELRDKAQEVEDFHTTVDEARSEIEAMPNDLDESCGQCGEEETAHHEGGNCDEDPETGEYGTTYEANESAEDRWGEATEAASEAMASMPF